VVVASPNDRDVGESVVELCFHGGGAPQVRSGVRAIRQCARRASRENASSSVRYGGVSRRFGSVTSQTSMHAFEVPHAVCSRHAL